MSLRAAPWRPAARGAVAAIAAAALAAAPGCGFGPGEADAGDAVVSVTRDYGSERLLQATLPEPPETETVLRVLDREAEITTRYGGLFVHSINGITGTSTGSRRSDWFFFINGIESSLGAAEVGVRGGDRIWWDYRDWTDGDARPRGCRVVPPAVQLGRQSESQSGGARLPGDRQEACANVEGTTRSDAEPRSRRPRDERIR